MTLADFRPADLPQASEPLAVGAELTDGGRGYRMERVEPPPNPSAFGHAWVARLGGS